YEYDVIATSTTIIYTLSLHDALPICSMVRRGSPVRVRKGSAKAPTAGNVYPRNVVVAGRCRRVNLSPKSGSNAASSLIDRCCPADRKSTRLNSSHLGISYAVFCLKKK